MFISSDHLWSSVISSKVLEVKLLLVFWVEFHHNVLTLPTSLQELWGCDGLSSSRRVQSLWDQPRCKKNVLWCQIVWHYSHVSDRRSCCYYGKPRQLLELLRLYDRTVKDRATRSLTGCVSVETKEVNITEWGRERCWKGITDETSSRSLWAPPKDRCDKGVSWMMCSLSEHVTEDIRCDSLMNIRAVVSE